MLVNVLTGGSEDDPAWLPASARLLSAGERGEVEIVLSALVLPELAGTGKIRGAHLTKQVRQERIRKVRDWVRSGRYTVVELDRHLADQASEMAIEHQLKGPDAVVLASAVRARCDALYTWDKQLIGLGAVGQMPILQPDRADISATLFDGAGLTER